MAPYQQLRSPFSKRWLLIRTADFAIVASQEQQFPGIPLAVIPDEDDPPSRALHPAPAVTASCRVRSP